MFITLPHGHCCLLMLPEPSRERVMVAEDVSSADYIIDDYYIVREWILDERYGTLLKLFESQHIAISAVYQARSARPEKPGYLDREATHAERSVQQATRDDER